MDAKATRSETPDRDELLAFELGLDEHVCDEIHRLPWGRLFLTRSLPLIWDSNWVGIEQTGLSVEQLVAIGDDALGTEGFGHRTIVPLGEADGKRIGAEVEAAPEKWPRWEVERNRYMVWRGAEDEPFEAREVKHAEIEGLRRAITIEESIPNDIPEPEETAEQLLELDRRYGVAGGDRRPRLARLAGAGARVGPVRRRAPGPGRRRQRAAPGQVHGRHLGAGRRPRR